VKPSQILREDEPILEANLRFWCCTGPFQAATPLLLKNICLSNVQFCKHLITSALRLGSSVGRAED
jgi:hypothetical protein